MNANIIMELTCLMPFAFGYYGKIYLLAFLAYGSRNPMVNRACIFALRKDPYRI